MDELKIFQEAVRSGLEAGLKCKPEPVKAIDMLSGKTAIIKEGICGFAWVSVEYKRRGRKFINGLKKKNLAVKTMEYKGRRHFCRSPNYGYVYWVIDHGQSFARKKAHAEAFASVLKKYGITACVSWHLN